MNKLSSPHGMKPQGVGPKIFKNAMPFLVGGILLGIFAPGLTHIVKENSPGLRLAGITMILLGAAMYIASMVQFLKEFSKGKLITKGVFKISRNPLYASWILLIFPGLALLCNNQVFFLAAISMYISLALLIKVEEEQLTKIFGQEYQNYVKKTGRLLLCIN